MRTCDEFGDYRTALDIVIVCRASVQAVADHDRLGEPQADYAQPCFYHNLKARDGPVFAAIFNEQLGVGGYVRYRAENLPRFMRRTLLGEQEHVVELEPTTRRLDRRGDFIRQRQIFRHAVGGRGMFEVEIGAVDGWAAPDEFASAA